MLVDALWRVALAATLSLFALTVTAASAQYDTGEYESDEAAADEYSDDEGGDEGTPMPAEAPGTTANIPGPGVEPGLPGPAPTFSQAPQTYTVREGDTLWDITQRFLNNPWYWPKVWSFNPHIENANWIEPGQIISFVGGEQLPTEVQPEEEPAEEIPDEVVTESGKRFVVPANMRLLDQGFVTVEELEDSGTILASFEEKSLLSTYDRAYLKFPQAANPGDRYVVFRTDREVKHPKTGEVTGYVTTLRGILRVTSVPSDAAPTGVIEGVQDYIERGDRLMPWTEALGKTVAARPNQVELEGIILATLIPKMRTIGEHHFVFVNKGRKHGVEVGNTFVVLHKGDPLDRDNRIGRDHSLPWEEVGMVMVVDARDDASTAMVVRTVRELEVGDRAIMRVGDMATASR